MLHDGEVWRVALDTHEACENYGCFEVAYDKIPTQSRAETFSAIRQLFDLPLYTKQKNVNLYPALGYCGQIAAIPLYESLGIEDASNFESLKSFTGLIQAVISILKSLEELNHIIVRAILDGYGLGEKTESIISCKTLLRVMRYRAPPAGEYMKGLQPHTDKIWTTILCEDEVSGLEVETKDGKWVKLSPSPGSFIFMVLDCLMAWYNCRMHVVKHRRYIPVNAICIRSTVVVFAFPSKIILAVVFFGFLFFALFKGFSGGKQCGFDLSEFFQPYPCLRSSVSMVNSRLP
ncbi:hypothetical protein I3842_01G298500 [Carya illinoinensis]|uniref:Uncharacterized protein n=1 Tax=Carya illinoinensis TaxID=32201 RepID=A0A922K7G3_CARIL|nr:hypothetical protein I3842_01G298500 [Carya illinoinensis]